MRLVAIAAGVAMVAASNKEDTVQESRQLRDNNNNLLRQPNSKKLYHRSEHDGYSQFDDQSEMRLTPNNDFYQDYNDIDYNNMQETSFSSHNNKIPPLTYAKNEPSSPAMSAVALLGFLYFLNLIQNVLNGRKKRSVDDVSNHQKEEAADGNVLSYLATLENAVQYFAESPKDPIAEGRSSSTMRQRASGIVSFISEMFDKIKSVFGLNREPISRSEVISPNQYQPEQQDPGFWGLLGKKVGMIATISDFLEDPNPDRLKRAFTEYERDEVDEGVPLAEEREMNAEERAFLPASNRKGRKLSRRRRYTDDGMNVWYEISTNPDQQDIVIGPQQILGTIFSLLKKTVMTNE